MRTTLLRRGLEFGKLPVTIRGTTQFHLSPFEQRAFAGAISQGLPNIFWRARSNVFTVVPRELPDIVKIPTNIGIARCTLSVATLVVVSDGVHIWVALRFSYH